MVTRKLKKPEREALVKLGTRVRKAILDERGYRSLDAFALAHHDVITKPTLYQICDGQRDMKLTTILGLAKALDVSLADLLTGLRV